MGGDTSREDVLLAVALGSSQQGTDRRLLPDRRSGIDRRKAGSDVPAERRAGSERRQAVRRLADRDEGATLLQKARIRLAGQLPRRAAKRDNADGHR
jgi:hypothetical protein